MRWRLSRWWESVRWTGTLAWWHVEARLVAIAATALAAAVAVAMLLEPSWSLRFERVLAWPVIALIGMFLFRAPLAGLIQGRGLRRFALGPGGISGELEAAQERAEEAQEVIDVDAAAAAVVVLGNLAQLYQFQIDFLRHLRIAANHTLTVEAAHEWFAAALMQRGVDDGEVEPLLNFLVQRELVALLDDGRYALTELGRQFVGRLDGFWYAPKTY